MKTAAIGLAALAMAGLVGWAVLDIQRAEARRAAVAQEMARLSFAPYAPQKVVYHVNSSGGWFDRKYKDLLGALTNHLAAVGAGRVELRVVLQGDGIYLLADASDNATLRAGIDKLRAAGVRFEVCRNTMVARGIGLDRLYGLKPEEIVSAAVAEVSALEGQGFVYMRF